MQADADVRILVVSSLAHRVVVQKQFKSKDDLNGPTNANGYYAKFRRYAFSKLLNIFWVSELSRRLAEQHEDGGDKILCLSLHPGSVATEGAFQSNAHLPWPFSVLANKIMKWFFTSPSKSAATILIAAAAQELRKEEEKYHGKYLVPVGKVVEPSKTARKETLAKELWSLTETILAAEGL